MVFRKSNDKTKLKIFICYKGIIKIHKNGEFCYSILLYLLHKVYNDEAGAVAVGQQAKGHVESESGDGRRRLQVDPRGQTAEQSKVKPCKNIEQNVDQYIFIHDIWVYFNEYEILNKQKMSQGCQESATKAIIRQADIRRKSGGYPD